MGNNKLNQFINVPNKEDCGGVVYCIRNINNGKMYVGKTQNFYNRILCHISALTENKHQIEEMQHDYNNGDLFLISCLYRVYDGKISDSFLLAKEWEYIKELQTVQYGYNRSEKPPEIIKENNMQYLRNEYITKEEEKEIGKKLKEVKQTLKEIKKEKDEQTKREINEFRQALKEKNEILKQLDRVRDLINKIA